MRSWIEEPLVSVVVVNRDRAKLLAGCLDSLLKQSLKEMEILVVDNASTDGSRQVVESIGDARVRLLPADRNLGFAGGCNLGISRARGRFVALLNNDARAEPGWLQALVQALQEHPKVGMCASKILLADSRIIDKAGHLIFWDGQNRGRGTGEPDDGQYDLPEEVLCPDGCAALYRKEMLNEVGGFDEAFFAYADDADLGLRCRWRGWTCLYVPEAVVYHRHSATSGPYSTQKIYWIERNRLWLAVKNFPLPLLLLNPFLTAYRWLWNLTAALAGRGAARNFLQVGSPGLLAWTAMRAYFDALRGLGRMLRKRRHIRSSRRLGDLEFYRLLLRHRISARALAFQDRP